MVVQAVEHIAQQRQQALPAGHLAVAGHHPQAARHAGRHRVQRHRQRRARDHGLQPGQAAGIGPAGHQRPHQPAERQGGRVGRAQRQAEAAQQQRQVEVGAPVGQQGAARRAGHPHKAARLPVPGGLRQLGVQLGQQGVIGMIVRVGGGQRRKASLDPLQRRLGRRLASAERQAQPLAHQAAARMRQQAQPAARRQWPQRAQQVQQIAQRAGGERAVLEGQHQPALRQAVEILGGARQSSVARLPQATKAAPGAGRRAVQQQQHRQRRCPLPGRIVHRHPAGRRPLQQQAVGGAQPRVQHLVFIGPADLPGQGPGAG